MEPQAQSIIIQISLAVNCQCASRWLLIYPPKTHYQNMSSLDAGNFGSALPSLTVERHHRRNSAVIEQWKVHSFTWLNFFSWITVGQTVWQLIKYMKGTLSVRFMLCHISNGPPRNHWNQRESNACLRYHTVHRPVISLQTHWSIAQNGLVPISCLTCTWNDAHPPTWGCFSWTPPAQISPFHFQKRPPLSCLSRVWSLFLFLRIQSRASLHTLPGHLPILSCLYFTGLRYPERPDIQCVQLWWRKSVWGFCYHVDHIQKKEKKRGEICLNKVERLAKHTWVCLRSLDELIYLDAFNCGVSCRECTIKINSTRVSWHLHLFPQQVDENLS